MKYFNELPSKTIAAFKRFPITITWSILGSIYVVLLIATEARIFDDYTAEMLTLILGVSWLIGAQFFSESLRDKRIGWLVKLVIIGLLATYYFSFPKEEFLSNPIIYIRWFLLFLAGHIFVFFAPFLRQWDKIDYWNYLQNIVISIARAALFSFVIFGGVALAILAVDQLFNISINDDIYGQLYVICLGVVNTFIYLSDFPKKIHNTQELRYSKALDVFLKFILIPILVLYVVIVYAYTVKIVLLWELPQGWVSYLITILAIIGFIIQIIIEPVRKTHPNALVRKFYPYFYFLLLPLLVLLFVAIYTRLTDYNFTENRYFLVVLAVWILGISLYMIISQKKKLSLIPISLFILCILASYGPWSAFNVSVRAQAGELKQLVNKIKSQPEELISFDEASQFRNIATYLKERDKLHELDATLGFKTSYIENSYSAGKRLLDSLYGGDKAKSITSHNTYQNDYYYYNQHDYNQQVYLNIEGYQTLVEMHLIRSEDHRYQMSHNANHLVIKDQENILIDFDIDAALIESIKQYQDLDKAPQEELSYSFTNDLGNYKLILKNLRFNKTSKTSISLIHLDGYLLIETKTN
ncbi:DUF4153 domain-containing protein [Mesonia sp. MT50]|uniref:DUF4153 domain-containing protein n=1 Tax=Mesonia profundi TaxID=3070998 RepID=A0ABU0ZZ39_9FLAO|nr:DUF4153 domain-containing protein [Mesonia profundi]MDQ7916634.1 DUF4153 domain-containing protein [Mesonia profundi]